MIETILRRIREACREPDYQHEGEDWSEGLCLAADIVEDVAAQFNKRASWIIKPGKKLALCGRCHTAFSAEDAKLFNYCPGCGVAVEDLED